MQTMITQVLLKVATNTHNIKFGKECLNMTPKAQVTKVKTDKLDMKSKNFWALKDTISGVKREPTEREEIFINRVTDKRLTSTIYKKL